MELCLSCGRRRFGKDVEIGRDVLLPSAFTIGEGGGWSASAVLCREALSGAEAEAADCFVDGLFFLSIYVREARFVIPGSSANRQITMIVL